MINKSLTYYSQLTIQSRFYFLTYGESILIVKRFDVEFSEEISEEFAGPLSPIKSFKIFLSVSTVHAAVVIWTQG